MRNLVVWNLGEMLLILEDCLAPHLGGMPSSSSFSKWIWAPLLRLIPDSTCRQVWTSAGPHLRRCCRCVCVGQALSGTSIVKKEHLICTCHVLCPQSYAPMPPHYPSSPSLQDEDRLALAENNAPTWEELNAALARGPHELETFNRLDREMDW